MSLLNMIGPVMMGPSSSHTAGACRIGLVARALHGDTPQHATITLHGSFAKTGRGHGTDRALVAGLLGFSPQHELLPKALVLAKEVELEVTWQEADLGDVHPNTAKLELANDAFKSSVVASSVGGGAVEVIRINDLKVSFTGERPTLVIAHQDAFGVIADVTAVVAREHINIAAITCQRRERQGEALMCLELDTPLNTKALERVERFPEVNWLRMLPAVMEV